MRQNQSEAKYVSQAQQAIEAIRLQFNAKKAKPKYKRLQKVQLPAEFSVTEKITAETTAACDCCGKAGMSQFDLVKIDSGQQLCPKCLAELRG